MKISFLEQKGFTIVEALIAVTVLLLGVTGALTAASQGIMSSTYSKEDVIAFNLAQEAIEMIRSMRDQNGINGTNWLTGIANSGDPCELGSSCTVDVNDSSGIFLHRCDGSCPVVKQDSSTGAYGYNPAWTNSPYTRTVNVSRGVGDGLNPSQEVSVKVTVSWSHGLVSRSFTAQENLFNWQS